MTTFIYTGIHVSDLQRAVKFYTDELGMKLLFISPATIKETGGRVAWLRSKGSRQILELNWYPEGYEYGGKSGLDHLAFEVKEIEATFKKFAKTHDAPLAPFDEGMWRLAYITDPDGNWIELGERLKKKRQKRRTRSKKSD